MAGANDLTRVSFIVMREMRRPLMTLVVVYSIAIFGMVFIPGPVVDNEPQYMSFFHAFYFMTYTATTTGFGEIPIPFSNAQRFWAILCLYVSVITWLYAIGSIIHLLQNPFFLRAVAEWKFSRAVERLSSPFVIVCGFGDTGSVLTRGLSDYGLSAVIIDSSDERIKALRLRNYNVPMPGLCADASIPVHLLEAGVQSPHCRAVVAITNSEEANLKISALARLLNANVGIVSMSKVEVFEETLATLGGEVHVIDPFKTFAKVLSAAMHRPSFHTLNNWLVRDRGASLNTVVKPPRGMWVISGYGRMGHEINRVLNKYGVETVVIDDSNNRRSDDKVDNYIAGRTTSTTLKQAKINEAVGIVAGANDDGHNLGILLNARYFNPDLFTIVRQNRHENAEGFAVANADMIMQPSLVTARRILFLLIAPLLKPFFSYLLQEEPGRKEEMKEVLERLKQTVGDKTPHIITVDFNEQQSKAVVDTLRKGKDVLLGDILRDPRDRDYNLDIVVFVIKSGDDKIILPGNDYKIKENDQMLFCGTSLATRLFNANRNGEYKLFYVQNGVNLPRGYVMQWFVKKTNRLGV